MDLKRTSKELQMNLYGVPMVNPLLCTYMIELKHPSFLSSPPYDPPTII